MSKRKRLHVRMRREAASEEGRRIVSSILGAAERLLQRQRYQDITTNRIAEAAGVSVGSFYQYFPNKESVLAELARALERRALELLSARLAHIAGASTGQALREFVGVLFDARMGNLDMRRALLEQVPRDWFADASTRVDAQVLDLIGAFLVARAGDLEVEDVAAASFVLFHAVEAVVEAAVAARPSLMEDGSLRRELTKLVCSYLGCADPAEERRATPPPAPVSQPHPEAAPHSWRLEPSAPATSREARDSRPGARSGTAPPTRTADSSA